MVEKLTLDNEKKKECDNNSEDIDYTNTGWEKININDKLPELLEMLEIKDKIDNCTELSGGYFNKVIVVETKSNRNVIKVSPLWNKGGLARENFVYSNLQNKLNKSFKLPKILSYIPNDNRIIPNHEILINEFIDGHKPTDDELGSKEFHRKISSFLDSIHDTPMNGYGWLDEKFIGKNDFWQSFLTNIDNFNLTINNGSLSEKDISWLIDRLTRECDNDFRSVLLYGDLKPENILIRNGDIYIIDFKNCFSGHQYYDTGIGLFFIPQIWGHIKIYLKDADQKNARKQIVLYAMRHAVSCLGHRINIGNKSESDIAIKRFFELKNLYKKIK